jgi:ribonuclease HI
LVLTESNNQLITIYTDGSCINNGQNNAQAGSSIWIAPNNPLNKALRVPGTEQSNQTGELYAILQAIKTAPTNALILIKTDSKYALNGLTKNLENWENKGWIGIKNANLFQTIVAWLRARSTQTQFQWVKGHNNERGNEEADSLAKEGANLQHNPDPDLTISNNFKLSGAKLSTMSQAMLYKGIILNKPHNTRLKTEIQLEITRGAIEEISGNPPTDENIWNSLQNKDISRQICTFLWKNMHNAYKIGHFWTTIPQHKHKSTCPHCQTIESMEHILTECIEQKTIWDLTAKLWRKKHNEELQITHGTIMGCSLSNYKKPNGKPDVGKNRLFRILISESSYLIWKLQCERRIQHGDNPEQKHTRTEIHNRWLATINKRLRIDCIATDKRK